jgi:hypothetical protein
VLSALGARAKFATESPLLSALSQDAPVELDKSQWRYVGFKGGSEPGVLHLDFLLQRADGKWFAVVVAVSDESRGADEGVVLAATTGVLAVLGGGAAPATGPAR